jgi:hypothetical protein
VACKRRRLSVSLIEDYQRCIRLCLFHHLFTNDASDTNKFEMLKSFNVTSLRSFLTFFGLSVPHILWLECTTHYIFACFL